MAVPNLFFHPFDIHPGWTYIEKVRDHNVILVRKDFYNKLNNFEINYALRNKLILPNLENFSESLAYDLEDFYEYKKFINKSKKRIKQKEKTNEPM